MGELVRQARAGEPWAIHEFLDRTHGKAVQPAPDHADNIGEVIAAEYERWCLRPKKQVESDEVKRLQEELEHERGRTAEAWERWREEREANMNRPGPPDARGPTASDGRQK